ncbi:MAG: HNH endonuclease [Planktomarina sp.]
MGRLTTSNPRLGVAPPRLSGAVNQERKGVRRSDGPINTARWQRLRLKILKRDGWRCQRTGVMLVGGKHAPNSAVVDHIRPHRGNLELFWDENNLQAVSKEYHDKTKQSIEKRSRA